MKKILFLIFLFMAVMMLYSPWSEALAEEANIISINYDYDFIVVDKGYNHGLSDGNVYYILKNAMKVGKLQVRNAKPDIAACDIVGLVEGTRLRLGEKLTLRTTPKVSLDEDKIQYRWKEIPEPGEIKKQEKPKSDIIQEEKFTNLKAKAEELAQQVAEEREELLVSFNFKDADIRNILRMISREKNINILAGGDVKGKVTVSFKDVNVYKALDAMLHRLGYSYVKENGIIKVIPLTESEKNTRSFVYEPNYKRVENLKASIEGLLTEKGKILVGRIAEHYTKGEDTEDTEDEDTEEVKSPYGTSNQMMIIDTPSNLKRIKKFVKKLDIPPKQVMIEAKFIDVQLEDSEELGVSWGIDSTSPEVPETRMSMVYEGNKGLGIFKYGSIGTTQLEATISALKEEKDVDILSEPSITTLNNKTATFSLNRYLAYFDVVKETTDAGTVTDYPWKELSEEKRPGINLEVTPLVTTGDKVLLKVIPQATILKEFLENPQGSRYPVVTKRKAETEVLIPNGHTLVIGGLIEKSKTEQRKGVPFLSDIPILGIPFRNTSESFSKRELMIFITPYIVSNKYSGKQNLKNN